MKSGAVDWVARHKKLDRTFTAIAQMISEFGSYIERETSLHRLRTINTEPDFGSGIESALASLSSQT